VLVATLGYVGGCSKAESPEQRVRQMLGEVEQAAEQKNLAALRGFIADGYTDPGGNDKKKIEALFRFYFLRNQSVHLYTYVESVEISKKGQAEVVVYVAMAGTPIPETEEIERLRADFVRFELELVEQDGEWQVQRARWRRAEPTDVIR
jgi:hypothetical protein